MNGYYPLELGCPLPPTTPRKRGLGATIRLCLGGTSNGSSADAWAGSQLVVDGIDRASALDAGELRGTIGGTPIVVDGSAWHASGITTVFGAARAAVRTSVGSPAPLAAVLRVALAVRAAASGEGPTVYALTGRVVAGKRCLWRARRPRMAAWAASLGRAIRELDDWARYYTAAGAGLTPAAALEPWLQHAAAIESAADSAELRAAVNAAHRALHAADLSEGWDLRHWDELQAGCLEVTAPMRHARAQHTSTPRRVRLS